MYNKSCNNHLYSTMRAYHSGFLRWMLWVISDVVSRGLGHCFLCGMFWCSGAVSHGLGQDLGIYATHFSYFEFGGWWGCGESVDVSSKI
jgi:hypothetical protein